jgi:hypothetical protein
MSTSTAPESAWITFKRAVIKETNLTNTKFALLYVADNLTDYGRIDEKFFPLIEKQLEDLQQGIFTDLRCKPDPYKGEGNWRLDDVYYQKLNAELGRISLETMVAPVTTPPQPELEQTSEANFDKDSVKITFSVDKTDHAVLKLLHKQLRETNPDIKTFEASNSYVLSNLLELLRSVQPEINRLYPKTPF